MKSYYKKVGRKKMFVSRCKCCNPRNKASKEERVKLNRIIRRVELWIIY